MFALTDGMHYYLCQHYVDMRKGMTGIDNEIMKEGHNQKRLEEGTFEVPRFNPDTGSYELSWKTFLLIMQGVSLRSAKCRKRFRLR